MIEQKNLNLQTDDKLALFYRISHASYVMSTVLPMKNKAKWWQIMTKANECFSFLTEIRSLI